MYAKFTERARKVMFLANEEAQSFNHQYIGTEHILLGLIKVGSGVAADVLKNLDVDLRKIRLEVEKLVQSGPDIVEEAAKLAQTPRAKKVIEYSMEEACNLNHDYVGTEHILLGLLRVEDGVAAQVLMNLGVTLEDVRLGVVELIGRGYKRRGYERRGYEVEQKFPVADLATVEAQLIAFGATVSQPRKEVDLYYAHPSRDFATTDEALRIRRGERGNSIAYKGPKVDATTKTRREIELPLSPHGQEVAAWEGLFEALGFMRVAEVRKHRRKATIPWQGRRIEASLDEVAELGTFVELELVVDDHQIESAKACIGSLAEKLGLSQSQRKSYLELLLEARNW